jgi:hypothetical protein
MSANSVREKVPYSYSAGWDVVFCCVHAMLTHHIKQLVPLLGTSETVLSQVWSAEAFFFILMRYLR